MVANGTTCERMKNSRKKCATIGDNDLIAQKSNAIDSLCQSSMGPICTALADL
jgi:hypothetical protein